MNDATDPHDALQTSPDAAAHAAQEAPKKHSLLFRFTKGLYALVRNGLLMGLLLVGGVYAAFQSERVQNYAADRAAEWLGKELHTTITIDKINIEWLSGLRLKGLYVADLHGDTLLYAQSLEAGIDTRALLGSELKLHHIRLDNTRATLDCSATDTVFNYQFLVDYFVPKSKTKTNKKAIVLNEWHGLEIFNLRFQYNDAHTGTFAAVGLPHLDMVLNDVNSQTQNLDIEKLMIEKPRINVRKMASNRAQNVVLYKAKQAKLAKLDSINEAKIDTNATIKSTKADKVKPYLYSLLA